MPVRYAHTNLVAHDWERLARFYRDVFACQLVPPSRDQQGSWLEAATGVPRAHLRGAHLRLPGHGEHGPTLEIYQYDHVISQEMPVPNRSGYGHLAFQVDDVDETLAAVLQAGGSKVGDVISVNVDGVGALRFTYARDPEGNIIEIQRWC